MLLFHMVTSYGGLFKEVGLPKEVSCRQKASRVLDANKPFGLLYQLSLVDSGQTSVSGRAGASGRTSVWFIDSKALDLKFRSSLLGLITLSLSFDLRRFKQHHFQMLSTTWSQVSLLFFSNPTTFHVTPSR